VRAGHGHATARAGIARIEIHPRRVLTQQRLGETQRERAFSHARWTAEKEATRQAIPCDGAAELFCNKVVSFYAVPSHENFRQVGNLPNSQEYGPKYLPDL